MCAVYRMPSRCLSRFLLSPKEDVCGLFLQKSLRRGFVLVELHQTFVIRAYRIIKVVSLLSCDRVA
jgi:hypothetical protein